MKFKLYEEFPNEESLSKLDYIDFPIDLVLAAKSLDEFENLENKVKKGNVENVVYWPLLSKEEGYWPNVFSKKTALMRVINEINKSKRNLEIVWDCEFGFERNESGNIVIGDTVKFKDNKELIRNFLKNRNRNIEITTVEIPNYLFGDSLLGVFGLAFDPLEYYTKKNKMVYSSLRKYAEKYIPKISLDEKYYELFKRELRNGVNKFGDKFSISLGCLSNGIIGNEPLMNMGELERELTIAKEEEINEVYLFRLNGINKEYSEVMKKFV